MPYFAGSFHQYRPLSMDICNIKQQSKRRSPAVLF